MTDLRERLSDAERDHDEIRALAAGFRKFAPYKGAQKEAYLEAADILDDVASTLIGAFGPIKDEIEDSEASRDHQERAELIRAHNDRVL